MIEAVDQEEDEVHEEEEVDEEAAEEEDEDIEPRSPRFSIVWRKYFASRLGAWEEELDGEVLVQDHENDGGDELGETVRVVIRRTQLASFREWLHSDLEHRRCQGECHSESGLSATASHSTGCKGKVKQIVKPTIRATKPVTEASTSTKGQGKKGKCKKGNKGPFKSLDKSFEHQMSKKDFRKGKAKGKGRKAKKT